MKEFIKIFFSFSWRINRKNFWISFIISIILYFLISFIFGGLIMIWINIFNIGEKIMVPIIIVQMIILSIFVLYLYFLIFIKRLHDLNKSWWMSLLFFIPIIWRIWLIIICWFFKWTEWQNQYWPDPLWVASLVNWNNEQIAENPIINNNPVKSVKIENNEILNTPNELISEEIKTEL